MMNKKITLILCLAAVISLIGGCSFVTVVPEGHEAEYTGKSTFDSSAQSGEDWEAIVDDITSQAIDINEALAAGSGVVAVSGSASIEEFNTDTPKYYLLLKIDGYDGEIKLQAGGVYSGTTIRDTQTVKEFIDFTNQTEWSEYAKSLNTEMDTNVIAPLGIDESVAGKTATFIGAAEISSDSCTITAVSLSIE